MHLINCIIRCLSSLLLYFMFDILWTNYLSLLVGFILGKITNLVSQLLWFFYLSVLTFFFLQSIVWTLKKHTNIVSPTDLILTGCWLRSNITHFYCSYWSCHVPHIFHYLKDKINLIKDYELTKITSTLTFATDMEATE